MTDANAILEAARARIAAAWPEATDVTGSAHAPEEARLPAWRARIDPGDTEPAGMGSPPSWLREADLTVEIVMAPSADPEATLQALGRWAQMVLLAPPADLGLDLLRCDPVEITTEHAAGKRQLGRVEAILRLQFQEPAAAPQFPQL
ncbi:hypothetical protein ACSSV4_000590 [Roseovarius sp. MBR-154]|jgi:hypothetical protein